MTNFTFAIVACGASTIDYTAHKLQYFLAGHIWTSHMWNSPILGGFPAELADGPILCTCGWVFVLFGQSVSPIRSTAQSVVNKETGVK